jgi:hypothetical protein
MEYLPAPQSVHVADVEAPVAVEYLPAPQSRHIEAPVAVEYLPAPQLRHTEAPVTVEYLPAPQSVHASGMIDGLYCPAAHAVQFSLFVNVNPVLHRVIFGKMTHQFAVKPRRVTEPSDVNVSLRNPAVELRTISGSWVRSV